MGGCPHGLERLQAHGSRSMWRSLQPGLTLVLPTDRVDKSASPLLGSPSPQQLPSDPPAVPSLPTAAAPRLSALLRHTLTQPQNKMILPSVAVSLTGLKVWDWGGFFEEWALIPFLVIYLFKREKTNKQGGKLLQMYNPVDSVKQSLCCKHKPSQFRSGIDGDES